MFDLDFRAVEESFDMDEIGGSDDEVEIPAGDASSRKGHKSGPMADPEEADPQTYVGKRVVVEKVSTSITQRFVRFEICRVWCCILIAFCCCDCGPGS